MNKRKTALGDLSEKQYMALTEVKESMIRRRNNILPPGMTELVLLMQEDSPKDLNLFAIVGLAKNINAYYKCEMIEYIFAVYAKYGVFVHLTFVDSCQWESPEWSEFPYIKEGKQNGLLLWRAEQVEEEVC